MHNYNSFLELITGVIHDTYLMIPVLFILYFVLEYFSHSKQLDLISSLKLSSKFGPLAGAILGAIPQCGMSVFVTSLFVSKRVSLGTLISTYLATSDEAIPVLIANGEKGTAIILIVVLKLVVSIITGYLIDMLIKEKFYSGPQKKTLSSHVVEIDTELHKTFMKEIIVHSAKRTLRIYLWVFFISIVLSIGFYLSNVDNVLHFINGNYLIEIIVAAIFGLIPNCAASIAIAEAFIHAGLSFSAAFAGLSSGAGYGPIVLFKDGSKKFAIQALLLTLFSSVVWGLVVYFLL